MSLEKQPFLTLVDENKGIIQSLCNSFYTMAEDQRDAFQDIVLHLWKARDTYRGESAISTWIYRISLNTLLSKRRKEQRLVSTEPLDRAHSLTHEAFADDHVELLQQIIRSLKDLDKAVVILFLEGYQHKEIASMLNISASNVGTRLNRIKASLSKRFNNDSYEARKL